MNLAENLTFQNLWKEKKLLPPKKKLKYILPFDKESKEKPLNLVSTDSVIKNNNLHDSGVKISIIGA